jgi:3-methyl-2-oxobutanoate hydroxymethyltransferase
VAPSNQTSPAAPPGGEAEVSPYGSGSAGAKQSGQGASTADGAKRPRRYRVHHLRDFKSRGEKWAMLTAYDQYTAEIFDQAGIPVLLVGDSAANNVFGYETTLRVTVDELIPLARAVAGAVERALVVADLPFGSYQASPEQAFHTAVRFMKEAGVHAVKLEGGRTVVPMVEKLTQSGIPVMAHIGFTPQSEHSIGGYRVQGRGDQAAGLIDDAVALAEAGAFSVVLEMVPGDVAAEITKRVPIPTIGIGAGRDTDAQVLVWQDMAGLRSGTMPRFVKQYADLRGILVNAAATYAAEVASGAFPAEEHTF